MKIYYWKGKKNFGDLLGSLLIKKFTHLESEWAEPGNAELVIVGSLLEHLPEKWNGVIAGIGKLHERTKLNLPEAKIIGLRGPLTAKGIKKKITIADPGLLCNELVTLQDKQYEIGLIPHWSDNDLEKNSIFLTKRTKIIRVSDDPLKVITEISQCRKIVSSSLHGIILADAFGIPRRTEIAPRLAYEGGTFKFRDYNESIKMNFQTGVLQKADHYVVEEKQFALFEMFEEIKKIFS